jgi:hypothetical protein
MHSFPSKQQEVVRLGKNGFLKPFECFPPLIVQQGHVGFEDAYQAIRHVFDESHLSTGHLGNSLRNRRQIEVLPPLENIKVDVCDSRQLTAERTCRAYAAPG